MRNTSPIAVTRLLEKVSTINSVCKFLTHMSIRMRVDSLLRRDISDLVMESLNVLTQSLSTYLSDIPIYI